MRTRITIRLPDRDALGSGKSVTKILRDRSAIFAHHPSVSRATKDLIRACEAFSEGDVSVAFPHIADHVVWTVVGHRTIKGLDGVTDFCVTMTTQGSPRFENRLTTIGEETVVVEGADKRPGGASYCDSYSFTGDKIVEIRSYCLPGS